MILQASYNELNGIISDKAQIKGLSLSYCDTDTTKVTFMLNILGLTPSVSVKLKVISIEGSRVTAEVSAGKVGDFVLDKAKKFLMEKTPEGLIESFDDKCAVVNLDAFLELKPVFETITVNGLSFTEEAVCVDATLKQCSHSNNLKCAAFMLIADDEDRDHANREKALALGEQWRAAGYHVISMRDDFKTIYGDGVKKVPFTFQDRPLVPIESDPRVLMTETMIECRLERFFISTACISFSDEKEKYRESIRCGNARNHHRAETASGKDIHLIFWPGLIVFIPKMTIFMQINREIKK